MSSSRDTKEHKSSRDDRKEKDHKSHDRHKSRDEDRGHKSDTSIILLIRIILGEYDDKKEEKKYDSKKREGDQKFPTVESIQKAEKKEKVENNTANPIMIEVIANDRYGKKVRVKCCPDDTIGDFKKLVAAHSGTRAEKIRLQKSSIVYKDHITLKDYEITHGTSLDLYYN